MKGALLEHMKQARVLNLKFEDFVDPDPYGIQKKYALGKKDGKPRIKSVYFPVKKIQENSLYLRNKDLSYSKRTRAE